MKPTRKALVAGGLWLLAGAAQAARECTAQEKGDLIAWLLTVEGGLIVPLPPDPVRARRDE
jgi:hypothetical protein